MSRSPSLRSIRRLFRATGTRPRGGSDRPSAFTRMKAHGTRTPATATTAECSSPHTPGVPWVAFDSLISYPHANSFTAHGSPTFVMDTRGTSGAPRERAGSADRVTQVDVTAPDAKGSPL